MNVKIEGSIAFRQDLGSHSCELFSLTQADMLIGLKTCYRLQLGPVATTMSDKGQKPIIQGFGYQQQDIMAPHQQHIPQSQNVVLFSEN